MTFEDMTLKCPPKCGTMVFWGSEDGREYGGENGSGITMEGYQPGEVSYLSPWCHPRGECVNARPGPQFFSLLEECVGGLEKFWWENGTPKLFSPNLITLAEKLGFNVEKFSKITGPSNSAEQS